MSEERWEEKAKSAQKVFEKALKGEKEPSREVDIRLVEEAIKDAIKARDKFYDAYRFTSEFVLTCLGHVDPDVEAVLRTQLLDILENWDRIITALNTIHDALESMIKYHRGKKNGG